MKQRSTHVFNDKYRKTSTFPEELKLSKSSAEWSAFYANFGDSSLLGAIDTIVGGNAGKTYYVDPTTGNDNNDGSAAHPFKTLVAPTLMPLYEGKIASMTNIAVLGNITDPADVPRSIAPTFVEDGCLSIYGVGAPTRKLVHGGPYTVTAAADIGSFARRVTVAGALWVVDEFVGYWARIVTGSAPGFAVPIYGNNTGDLSSALGFAVNIQAGDTIEIIEPAISIAVDSLAIYARSNSLLITPLYETCRLTLANLVFDASASTSPTQFSFKECAPTVEEPLINTDFVKFKALLFGISLQDVTISAGYPVDTSYIINSNYGITNDSFFEISASLAMISSGGRGDLLVSGDGFVNFYTGSIFGGVRFSTGNWRFLGACANISSFAKSGEAQCWLAGVDATTVALDLSEESSAEANIHVEGDCEYAIGTGALTDLYLHGICSCSPTLTVKSALLIDALARVQIHSNCAGFLGATVGQQAYIFSSNNTKSATWPAASTLVTDSLGAQLMRTT